MTTSLETIDKGNILIVDDNPHNLRFLYKMLSDQGYRVRCVSSGRMALSTLQLFPPDLVLLDIMMPEMDGYQICEKLKSNPKTCEIPVIFISALDDILDKVKAFQVGGRDYITKPFKLEEVLARIENQLALRNLQKQLQERNHLLEEEIQNRVRAEEEIRLLLATIQAMSEAENIHDALSIILEKVCQAIDWDAGEAWLPADDQPILEYSQGWYTNDASLEQFRHHSEKIKFAAGIGLPGRIWLSHKPEYIVNISSPSEQHPFLRKNIANEVNIKACLGVPILLQDKVLAILVFLKKAEIQPDERLLALVNAVATQLGAFIQRKKAEAALKNANLKLQRLSQIDGLTGVANRRQFNEYLNKEWRRSMRETLHLSLIMCDVDFFKPYNDTYGHQAGDRCLQKVAKMIRSCLRRPADLVARYGGEEFAIILPNTNAKGAIYVAETIRRQVETLQLEHTQSSVHQFVTLSLGVSSIIPQTSLKVQSLIQAADQALYLAKNKGRNCTVLKSILLKREVIQ